MLLGLINKEKDPSIFIFILLDLLYSSCCFRIYIFTVDTLPFGGVGQSGMGRYRGKFGFDTFSNQKALLIRGFFADALFA